MLMTLKRMLVEDEVIAGILGDKEFWMYFRRVGNSICFIECDLKLKRLWLKSDAHYLAESGQINDYTSQKFTLTHVFEDLDFCQ
jgi:hypothetical protein